MELVGRSGGNWWERPVEAVVIPGKLLVLNLSRCLFMAVSARFAAREIAWRIRLNRRSEPASARPILRSWSPFITRVHVCSINLRVVSHLLLQKLCFIPCGYNDCPAEPQPQRHRHLMVVSNRIVPNLHASQPPHSCLLFYPDIWIRFYCMTNTQILSFLSLVSKLRAHHWSSLVRMGKLQVMIQSPIFGA